jgi:hypothetical protein
MNEAEFVKDFTPTHSSASPHDVISAGPGVDVLGLYSTGAANGVVTIGGFSPTVGACGGYVLGGGTGENPRVIHDAAPFLTSTRSIRSTVRPRS